MKTTQKSVTVEVMDGGKMKRYVFPIVTSDGDLMTHRLRRLMAGKIGHGHSAACSEQRDVRYLGMIWRPPYTLLQEIVWDRLRLQHDLSQLGDASELAEMPITVIPDRAPNDEITSLTLRELRARTRMKVRINELSQKKELLSCDGETAGESLGWVQP